MQNYYQHFPEIDNVYWTDYFLKEFIPKYKIYETTPDTGSAHIIWNKKDFAHEPEILKLSKELTIKLKFPPIEYFFMIRHNDIDQAIHTDGTEIIRNSSFNLPLLGYAGTEMRFYEIKNKEFKPIIGDTNYYDKNDLIPIDEFQGENNWVLVNTSVPHNIVNINSTNPRFTVCFRFIGNPTFEMLIKNAKS